MNPKYCDLEEKAKEDTADEQNSAGMPGYVGFKPISCDQVAWLLGIFNRYLPQNKHPRISRERDMLIYGMLYEVMEIAGLQFTDDSATDAAKCIKCLDEHEATNRAGAAVPCSELLSDDDDLIELAVEIERQTVLKIIGESREVTAGMTKNFRDIAGVTLDELEARLNRVWSGA
jgi:hypothetical protein